MTDHDYYNSDLSQLIGKTLTQVTQNGRESIAFTSDTGERWRMYHAQDCCESCVIEDVAGDLSDLVGSPIVMAEAVTNSETPKPLAPGEYEPDSFTWTFYKLATVKGYVTIRWYGESNGYYSETASFVRVGGDS